MKHPAKQMLLTFITFGLIDLLIDCNSCILCSVFSFACMHALLKGSQKDIVVRKCL